MNQYDPIFFKKVCAVYGKAKKKILGSIVTKYIEFRILFCMLVFIAFTSRMCFKVRV